MEIRKHHRGCYKDVVLSPEELEAIPTEKPEHPKMGDRWRGQMASGRWVMVTQVEDPALEEADPEHWTTEAIPVAFPHEV